MPMLVPVKEGPETISYVPRTTVMLPLDVLIPWEPVQAVSTSATPVPLQMSARLRQVKQPALGGKMTAKLAALLTVIVEIKALTILAHARE